jgi:predicted ATPase/DNA-binding SARP family transcriptional activator
MHQPLQIFLFGSPQITYQGQPLTGFVSAKVRALLIYLAVTARPQSRDHLAELLWADTPASIRTNLRKALSNLRQLIGNILVEDGKESITLDTQQLWVDVVEFSRLLNQGADQDASELYQADFLTGFNLSLSYEFEAWVLSEQSRLKTQMVDLLRRMASQHEGNGELTRAIATVRRLLALEPWQEEAHSWLMGLLAQDDQRSAALAHFEICKRVLKEELAVAPSAETLALVERIRQQPTLRPQAIPTLATKAERNNLATRQDTKPRSSVPTSSPTNLPAQLTPLLGREDDQRRLVELLTKSARRLVTLVGPPGIDKTRLGLAVAKQVHGTFADGVYFVPLAAITDAELIASTIGNTLGLVMSGSQTPQATLCTFLRDKEMLLLLDNFEQLMAATSLVVELLEASPRLQLLITSRERLHIDSEQLYRVSGLALPAAINLFVQRIQALDVDFALTPDNQAVVGEICQQLDYLPLAIELSAAQVELLTLPELLTRIRKQRLSLLQSGLRSLPERQRTLRRAIESSYHLLNEGEQALFRTLGIFVGGFDQAAVEELGFDIATLQSLIHKSLVQMGTPNNQTRRFLLLETLHEYALEQLAQAGEATVVAQRHADYYLHFVEEAETHLKRADQAEWLERLALDHDNLRAALQWSFNSHQNEISARLAIALSLFWDIRGHLVEGWQWLQRLVEKTDQPELRAKLLLSEGRLAQYMGKYDLAFKKYTESLSLFRQLNDNCNIAWVLLGLGNINLLQNDLVQARRDFDETLVLFRQLDDFEGIAATVLSIGDTLPHDSLSRRENRRMKEESLVLRRRTGNLRGVSISLMHIIYEIILDEEWALAHQYQQELLQISEQIGFQYGIASSLNFSGIIAYSEGKYEIAKAAFEKSLNIYTDTGDAPFDEILEWLGKISLKMGDYEQAQHLFEQEMQLAQTKNSPDLIADNIGCFASLAMYHGQAWRALCLASAGFAICEKFDIRLDRLEREVFDHTEGEARRLLTEADAAAAWAAGRAMTREQAIEYALASSHEIVNDQDTTYG